MSPWDLANRSVLPRQVLHDEVEAAAIVRQVRNLAQRRDVDVRRVLVGGAGRDEAVLLRAFQLCFGRAANVGQRAVAVTGRNNIVTAKNGEGQAGAHRCWYSMAPGSGRSPPAPLTP